MIEGEAPMLGKLEIMRMAQAMAQHAGTRQTAIAQNIANADTPGYKARDVTGFAKAYQSGSASYDQRATRAGHLTGSTNLSAPELSVRVVQDTQSPNGNTVSLEAEMMRASDVKHHHDMALTIYQTSLGILRTSLGRR